MNLIQNNLARPKENNSFSPEIFRGYSRRRFMQTAGLGALALSYSCGSREKPVIPGFEKATENTDISKNWVPVSDRKIKMGIVGYGYCKFGAAFGFQNHPNVEIVAVSDLIPERCEALAKDCKCSKTYPSLEELVKDETIEAVFVATDAPSHAKHAIEVLKHGKHVASAVPAVFGSLEDAELLFETVKTTGLKYMMFETSVFRDDLFSMRQIYNAGGFGKLVYSEGEYYHYMEKALPSYLNWRLGLPPQWYPTHSNAYGIAVDGGSFTEVSCYGMPSILGHLQPANNAYKNPFGTEIALFRTEKGGMSRMAVSWDTPGDEGERGRVRGQKGSYHEKFEALAASLPDLTKPPLPPGVEAGGHGGSHGYLMNEFVTAILQDRKPLIDIAMSLNLTVPGIVAHESALKNVELLKIPQYRM
jgi:predicted dehydrogenase